MEPSPPAPPNALARPFPPFNRSFWLAVVAIGMAAAAPAMHLAELGWTNDLYSHVLLIPVVSAYFFWRERAGLACAPRARSVGLLIVSLAALALAIWTWLPQTSAGGAGPSVRLSAESLAVVLLVWGFCGWHFKRASLRKLAFPLGFLVLMIPFPPGFEAEIEHLLQHGSAETAEAFFRLIGTPLLRDGLTFHLPGISLEIAPECSGIRSSLALFIVSILAGKLYLQSGWKRVLLSSFVAPLALIRNGFRVFTIGELCIRVGPEMIHSYIHRHGGPIFFALSLIPFTALLWFLSRFNGSRLPVAPVLAKQPSGP